MPGGQFTKGERRDSMRFFCRIRFLLICLWTVLDAGGHAQEAPALECAGVTQGGNSPICTPEGIKAENCEWLSEPL